MNASRIVVEIDAQITRLQQARALLAGAETSSPNPTGTRKRGRTKGSGKKALADTITPVVASRKRTLSAAGRKAIADSMKKRWAERKKAQAK